MSSSSPSSRIVYINGEFVPESEAKVSVFDRGFLFGDGVYEVSSVIHGKLIDNERHLMRLERSLNELDLPHPDMKSIESSQLELIRQNNLSEGIVYMQVTRGTDDRSFVWPDKNRNPTLVMFTQKMSLVDNPTAERGIRIAFIPDLRWKRRDIKTVMLLPASWAKMQARAMGADDAWMTEKKEKEGEDVYITEGTSNNAFILQTDNGNNNDGITTIITRQLGNEILHGITRRLVLELVQSNSKFRLEERPFTTTEAKACTEAFVTSASSFVMPVVEIDGVTIGDGTPGPITKQLRKAYIDAVLAK